MAGHSRSKNGVASARLRPGIHVFLADGAKDVDARHKAGHDELKDGRPIHSVTKTLLAVVLLLRIVALGVEF